MSFFVNPFRKHDVADFPDVLVPLQEAPRHPSVVRAYDEDAAEKSEGGRPGLEYGPYTIEGLKAEIDQDIAASGHNTIYDRTCLVRPVSIRRIRFSLNEAVVE